MPKIDLSTIAGYQNMTAEEKIAALEAFEYTIPNPDYTGYVKKELLDKANSEAANFKKQLRDKMSEDEKKAAEEKEAREAMEKELADLRKEKAISQHTASFLGLGYSQELAVDTANALFDNDMAKVLANQKKFQEEREKEIKKELLKGTPQPAGGGAPQGLTKEQFKKMTMDQKTELYNTDPETFKRLSA